MKKKKDTQGIIDALHSWKASEHYLQNVSDPALVDYAVFESEAARRKYIYMLNRQRGTEN